VGGGGESPLWQVALLKRAGKSVSGSRAKSEDYGGEELKKFPEGGRNRPTDVMNICLVGTTGEGGGETATKARAAKLRWGKSSSAVAKRKLILLTAEKTQDKKIE